MNASIARFVRSASLVALGLLVGGCGTTPHQTTYLGNLSGLERVPKTKVAEVWRKPGADFSRYNRIQFGDLDVLIQDDPKSEKVTPEDVERLKGIFSKAVKEALGEAYPLAAEAAPDVLKIRAAITRLKPGNPAANAASVVVLKCSLFTGEAAVEAEYCDSLTGERLLAVRDDRKGRSLLNVKDVWSKWGDVEGAMKFWAGRLRVFLDTAHGVAKDDSAAWAAPAQPKP
jgi:hypothetical protein